MPYAKFENENRGTKPMLFYNAPNQHRTRAASASSWRKKASTVPMTDISIMTGELRSEAFLAVNPLGPGARAQARRRRGDDRNASRSAAIFEALHPDPPMFGTEPARDRADRHVDPPGRTAAGHADRHDLGSHASDHRAVPDAIYRFRREQPAARSTEAMRVSRPASGGPRVPRRATPIRWPISRC